MAHQRYICARTRSHCPSLAALGAVFFKNSRQPEGRSSPERSEGLTQYDGPRQSPHVNAVDRIGRSPMCPGRTLTSNSSTVAACAADRNPACALASQSPKTPPVSGADL